MEPSAGGVGFHCSGESELDSDEFAHEEAVLGLTVHQGRRPVFTVLLLRG